METLAISESSPARGWAVWRAWIRLMRPLNFVLFMGGTALGGLLVAGTDLWMLNQGDALFWAMISAACIGAGGNIINDYFDVEIDQVNRPDRPLPAGLVTRQTAWWLWIGVTMVGLLCSALLSLFHVIIAALSVGLLYAYSAWFKRQLLIGNILVGVIVALALLYGGWAIEGHGTAWVGAGFAFFVTVLRELIKDIEDLPGDTQFGARTLPIVTSPETARIVALVLLAFTIILTPLPFLFLDYGGVFLLLLLPANLMLCLAGYHVWTTTGFEVGGASWSVKISMVLGMVALLLA